MIRDMIAMSRKMTGAMEGTWKETQEEKRMERDRRIDTEMEEKERAGIIRMDMIEMEKGLNEEETNPDWKTRIGKGRKKA